ncbi:MAG TPA: SRPBCC family protein [Pirellulales bacterium]|jgi:phenylpropionate dioxygenase-like ring-hydroxylating dioxygenase large terminal subunit|nr:SRPBCC family protein [Pirellulales bacterium]
MFVHRQRLPHLLSPDCYWSEEHYARELMHVLRPSWHLVATQADLARPGQFVTTELLGEPIQVRNIDGQIHAFSNVCVHRHCLLTSQARGCSEKIRCQYHGWEYDRTGRTAHIPEPKSFVPFQREVDRLAKFRVATCGQLVFVSLADDGPSLAEQFGEPYALMAEAFGDRWRQTWSWSPEFACNWKIPIENSLEGYHIPAVHPKTFKVAPTSERTVHVLRENYTSFQTHYVPFSRVESVLHRFEDIVVRIVGVKRSDPYYSHYHFFPGLMVAKMDMANFSYSVTPTGPKTCRGELRLFEYHGDRPGLLARAVLRAWAPLQRELTKMVVQEDLSIYEPVQRGMEASHTPGVLGAIEERIHAFQQYLCRACDIEASPESPAAAEAY